MALQTLKGGAYLPRPPVGNAGIPSFTATSLVINAADESAAFIIQIPRTGTITDIAWGSRTTTTGMTVDVRLETVSGGFPTGTLYGANTNGSQVVNNADDNTTFITALTAGAAVTAGDLVAVVIKAPTASFGNMQITAFGDEGDPNFPYVALNTGISPAVSYAVITAIAPMLSLRYNDGAYYPVDGAHPASATVTATTLSTSTTPDVIGARFKVPGPVTIDGAWVWADIDGDAVVKLVSTDYNQGANTATLKAEGTIIASARKAVTPGIHFVRFSTTVDLVAGTYYRLLLEPSSTTSIIAYDFDVPNVASLDAYVSQDFHLTTAKDPTVDGSWTNYNSGTFRVPYMGLRIAKIDDGASVGGGGLLTHPGMSGGMRA
jgi:hypothetical protein